MNKQVLIVLLQLAEKARLAGAIQWAEMEVANKVVKITEDTIKQIEEAEEKAKAEKEAAEKETPKDASPLEVV